MEGEHGDRGMNDNLGALFREADMRTVLFSIISYTYNSKDGYKMLVS